MTRLSLILSAALLLAGVAHAAPQPPAPAKADPFLVEVDGIRQDSSALHDEVILAKERLHVSEAAHAKALEEHAKGEAAHAEAEAKLNAEIVKRQKVLNRWYVRLALYVAGWFKWIAIGLSVISALGLSAYAIAIVGGLCHPAGAMFELSGKLISALPLANICESVISLFRKTKTVLAREVPVVGHDAIVAPTAGATPGVYATTVGSLLPRGTTGAS